MHGMGASSCLNYAMELAGGGGGGKRVDWRASTCMGNFVSCNDMVKKRSSY